METINVTKDTTLVIDTQADVIEININNCKAIITDVSNSKKIINVNEGELDYCYVNKGSNISSLVNVNGGKISVKVIDVLEGNSQNDYLINLNEEYSEANFSLVSIAKQEDIKEYKIKSNNNKIATHVVIDCFGISENRGINNYYVNSFIKKGAKKSIVSQNSKVLLFDKESKGINNPILEIEENDVKANHGSSIGMIDEDTLFYLTSRGIKETEARKLVSIGRVQYLIDEIRDEKIKESLLNELEERV